MRTSRSNLIPEFLCTTGLKGIVTPLTAQGNSAPKLKSKRGSASCFRLHASLGISFLALMLIVISGCGAGSAPAPEAAKEDKPPVAVETAVVERRDTREILSAQGVFEASTGGFVRLAPVSAGRLAEVFVKEGDLVSPGQIVARIDIRSQQAVIQQTAAAVRSAASQADQSRLNYQAAAEAQRTSVKVAKLALESTKRQASTDLRQAEFALRQAEADLTKLKNGARPQELSQSKEAVRQAQTEYDRLNSQATRDQALLDKGFVSAKAAEDSRAAANNALSALKSAKESLSLVQEGARKEEIISAEAKLSAAKELLKSTQELGPMKIDQAAAAYAQAQQDSVSVAAKAMDAQAMQRMVEQRQAEAQVAGVSRDNGEIRATFSGRVMKRLHSPGDQVDNTTPVIEVMTLAGAKQFRSDVAARDALRLVVGQAAMVEIPGNSQPATGHVASLGQADPQTGLLSVRISLDHAPTGVPAGLYAMAKIITNRFPKATVAPQKALVSRDGKNALYTVVDGVAHRVEVEIGPVDQEFVMIRSGVKPGDVVITLGQNELDDGAKVQTAKPDAEAGKTP